MDNLKKLNDSIKNCTRILNEMNNVTIRFGKRLLGKLDKLILLRNGGERNKK